MPLCWDTYGDTGNILPELCCYHTWVVTTVPELCCYQSCVAVRELEMGRERERYPSSSTDEREEHSSLEDDAGEVTRDKTNTSSNTVHGSVSHENNTRRCRGQATERGARQEAAG